MACFMTIYTRTWKIFIIADHVNLLPAYEVVKKARKLIDVMI